MGKYDKAYTGPVPDPDKIPFFDKKAVLDEEWDWVQKWCGDAKKGNKTSLLSPKDPLYQRLEQFVRETCDEVSYSSGIEGCRLIRATKDGKLWEYLTGAVKHPAGHKAGAYSVTIHKIRLINNPTIWKRYVKKREQVRADLDKLREKRGDLSLIDPLHRVLWTNGERTGLPVLDRTVGEVLLYQGRSKRATMKAATGGAYINPKKPDSFWDFFWIRGYGALGKGLYLADSFSKAAVYVGCPKPDCGKTFCDCKRTDGKKVQKVMLVFRATLGHVYIDTKKTRKKQTRVKAGYHSSYGPSKLLVAGTTFGTDARSKKTKSLLSGSTFDSNEFLVDNVEQVYPQFCIYYTDNEEDDAYQKELAKSKGGTSHIPPMEVWLEASGGASSFWTPRRRIVKVDRALKSYHETVRRVGDSPKRAQVRLDRFNRLVDAVEGYVKQVGKGRSSRMDGVVQTMQPALKSERNHLQKLYGRTF